MIANAGKPADIRDVFNGFQRFFYEREGSLMQTNEDFENIFFDFKELSLTKLVLEV